MSDCPDLLNHLLPPRLHPNEITVWVLGPVAVATVLSSHESLSSGELVRATNIARADKRREFIAGRRALRWFLAQQRGDEPSCIQFDRVSGLLQPIGRYRDLTCSLAHRHGGSMPIRMELDFQHRCRVRE